MIANGQISYGYRRKSELPRRLFIVDVEHLEEVTHEALDFVQWQVVAPDPVAARKQIVDLLDHEAPGPYRLALIREVRTDRYYPYGVTVLISRV